MSEGLGRYENRSKQKQKKEIKEIKEKVGRTKQEELIATMK